MDFLGTVDWFNAEAKKVADSLGMGYDPNPINSPVIQNLIQPTQSTPNQTQQPTKSVYYMGAPTEDKTLMVVVGLGLAWLLLKK